MLTVATPTPDGFRTLADLRGRRVATLGGTIAYEILLRAERDLRPDAPCRTTTTCTRTATCSSDASMPCCSTTCSPSGASARCRASRSSRRRSRSATTSASWRAKDAPLRDAINDMLRGAMRDGSLERIFRKWNVWNDDQPTLHAQLLAGEDVPAVVDRGRGLDGRPRAPPRCRDGRPRGATSRRCCARRSSRSCSRACRWHWPSSSAC